MHVCFDGLPHWLVKNDLFPLFVRWPDLFLASPSPAWFYLLFAMCLPGVAKRLVSHLLSHATPRLSSYLKKNKIIMVNDETF